MFFTSPQQVLCHLRHAFHMDDDGSRASSREFQEPDLPWAEDPPPNVQFGGEDRRISDEFLGYWNIYKLN